MGESDPGQVGGADTSEAGEDLGEDAGDHDRPRAPGDDRDGTQHERAIIRAGEGGADLFEGGERIREGVGAKGDEGRGDTDENAQQKQGCGEPSEPVAGHRLVPLTARLTSTSACPVTRMVRMPTSDRNFVV